MKILVIDDDPLIRRMVRRMLIGPATDRGATVHVIDPAVIGARREIIKVLIDCDVVLSDYDYRLPGLNGLDVLRLAPAGCRRVLMSGDPPSDVPSNVVVLGKPFTREGLFAALGIENEGGLKCG